MNTNAKETLLFHRKKETKKKDRFVKFHPSSKQMILFASASDPFVVPIKPKESCQRFINPTTNGIAEQELSMQLKNLGLSEMAFATGLTLSLYSGKFLYAVCNSPSNFSCFSIYEGNHLDKQNQQDPQLILHLIKTKDKGQSIKDIKVNKQKIKAPTTYIELMQQFKGFSGLISIFFGRYSIAHQAITSVIQLVSRSKQSFKAQVRTDTKFCCKFMYTVDTRFQLWLEDCMTATQLDRINDSILDCCLLIESVCFGTFALNHPSSFTEPPTATEQIEQEAAKAPAAAAGAAGGTQKEGSKKGEKKQNSYIKNNSPCHDFKLKEGKTWVGTFRNKLVSKRPIWNDKAKMCPRWHIHGHCFESCVNANSHVEASKIPADKISQCKDFMEAIRNLNTSA